MVSYEYDTQDALLASAGGLIPKYELRIISQAKKPAVKPGFFFRPERNLSWPASSSEVDDATVAVKLQVADWVLMHACMLLAASVASACSCCCFESFRGPSGRLGCG